MAAVKHVAPRNPLRNEFSSSQTGTTQPKRFLLDEHTPSLHARLPVLAVLVGLLAPGPCAAQPTVRAAPSTDTSTTAQSTTPRPVPLRALSTNTLSVWGGGSVTTADLIGNIQRAQVGIIGLRYHRLLVPPTPDSGRHGPTLTYTVGVFPAFLVSIPPETVSVPPGGGPSTDSETSVYQQGLDTYGIGASPAGLRITFRPANRVQPFLAGSTGLVYFVDALPNERGKHLNFMFDVGAGVQVVLTSNLILTAGYRYLHLSNGFRGQINPGIDANLLHLGVAVSR